MCGGGGGGLYGWFGGGQSEEGGCAWARRGGDPRGFDVVVWRRGQRARWADRCAPAVGLVAGSAKAMAVGVPVPVPVGLEVHGLTDGFPRREYAD